MSVIWYKEAHSHWLSSLTAWNALNIMKQSTKTLFPSLYAHNVAWNHDAFEILCAEIFIF